MRAPHAAHTRQACRGTTIVAGVHTASGATPRGAKAHGPAVLVGGVAEHLAVERDGGPELDPVEDENSAPTRLQCVDCHRSPHSMRRVRARHRD